MFCSFLSEVRSLKARPDGVGNVPSEPWLNPQDIDQFLNRSSTLLQRYPFFRGEIDLDDLLKSTSTEFARNTNIESINAVLALEISRARKNFFLVLEYGFRHLNRSRGRCVISRACFQKTDDFCTTVRSALHDCVQLILREKFSYRNPCTRRKSRQWYHRVSMTSKYKRSHVLYRNVQRLSKKTAHPGRIKYTRHTNYAVLGKARTAQRYLAHCIERI